MSKSNIDARARGVKATALLLGAPHKGNLAIPFTLMDIYKSLSDLLNVNVTADFTVTRVITGR